VDNLVLPMMDALLTCLCDALEASPGGATCFCALVPGGPPPMDSCGCNGGKTPGCGTAWVRLVRTFPSAVYPAQDTSVRSCGVQQAAVFELGVYRCLPTLGANGSPPTSVEQTQATITQTGDWAAMVTAVRCCDTLTGKDPVLGSYETGSLGGCGGGRLTVTTRLTKAPR